ncbi:lectin BRA-3-like [Babylonia areolata]|uniref:lectin BRA-3-like n=1 Tax=Babylonia areolata TaxID=304850 RepID=UPI003FD5AC2E
MLRVFVFLCIVASVCLAVSVNDCPASLPRNQYLRAFGNRCYQFVLEQIREFDAAERECRARGGHLVTIRNLAVQSFLYNTLRQDFRYLGIVWIGLSDQESEGDFVWVDGSPAQFTFWAWNQPGSILGSFQNCVAMDVYHGGKWHVSRCSDGLVSNHHEKFVCEFPLVSGTTPAITSPPTTQPQPPATTTPQTTPAPPTTTTPKATTPQQKTTVAPEQSTTGTPTSTTPFGGCPTFNCNLDCGLSGYKVDDNNCLVCQCEE